jgi:hypothetical protein
MVVLHVDLSAHDSLDINRNFFIISLKQVSLLPPINTHESLPLLTSLAEIS